MKTLKKIIRVIIATIIILIVALNVYNFINLKVLNKDLSTIFGYSTLEVVSGSMKPTIEVGELIVIDTNAKDYKKDDIVTFYDVNGAFVTHRIVSIDEDKMITKGDNNDSKDDATDVDKIVGKYVCKIPVLGAVLSVIQKPVILFLILVIGILYSYLVSTEEPKEKKIKQKTHSKKLSKRSDKQLLKELQQVEKAERKQEKQDFKEFKQWKKEQLKQQEMEEFLEFRKMKEQQRQAARQKEIEKIEEILEEEISNEPVISQNTNPAQKRKPRKKHKSHKQQKRNNQKNKNKKHKSKKNYKYNQTHQNYNQRR